MAWNLRPYDDSQIDPFNAPDPIMPSDEPSFEGHDADDGAERLKRHELERRLEQARRDAARGHGHQGHTWHTPAAASTSDEPIATEESPGGAGTSSSTPAKPPRSHARRTRVKARAAGGSAGRGNAPTVHTARRVTAFIVIALLVSGFIPTMVTCSLDWGDSSSMEYDYTETELAIKAEAEDEMVRQMKDLLDTAIAGDELARGLAEETFADACERYLGLSPEEAGIDSAAVVSWLFENMSYDTPEASCYVYNMGDVYEVSGTVYVDVSAPSLSDVAFSLRWDVPDGIWEYQDDGTAALTEGGAAALQEELPGILEAHRSEATASTLMLSCEGTAEPDGSGLSISYDTSEWENELTWLLG